MRIWYNFVTPLYFFNQFSLKNHDIHYKDTLKSNFDKWEKFYDKICIYTS